ncbi:MAG: hypothetical protein IKL35_05370 [Muribaculaceae bacterium]|nr:hypothetical protein [Muribaculaceae bacterium]
MKRLINISAIAVLMAVLMFPCRVQAQNTDEFENRMEIIAETINEELDTTKNFEQNVEKIAYKLKEKFENIDANTTVVYNEEARKTIEAKYDHEEDMMEYALSIVAVIGGLLTGILIFVLPIFFICYFIYRKRTIRYRIAEKAIEKNMTLPDSFFAIPEADKKSRLQSGLVWIGWGLGLICLFLVCSSIKTAMIGLIPLFVGVAKLITYFVEDRKKDNNDNNNYSNDETDVEQI